jgi:hypothetical protein
LNDGATVQQALVERSPDDAVLMDVARTDAAERVGRRIDVHEAHLFELGAMQAAQDTKSHGLIAPDEAADHAGPSNRLRTGGNSLERLIGCQPRQVDVASIGRAELVLDADPESLGVATDPE